MRLMFIVALALVCSCGRDSGDTFYVTGPAVHDTINVAPGDTCAFHRHHHKGRH